MENPWNYVLEFEKSLAEYTGAKYAITTDCATHAIELCLRYLNPLQPVQIPKRTYLSIPMMIEKLGLIPAFVNNEWKKYYILNPYPIIDGSVHFDKDCYVPEHFYCISFQHQKRLSLGRGGAILLDDDTAYQKLLKMRYDGRSLPLQWHVDMVDGIGYHYYMTPEQARTGLEKLQNNDLKPYVEKSFNDYPDLTNFPVFSRYSDEKVDHNGYHNFLYVWKPREGRVLEISTSTDGYSKVERIFDLSSLSKIPGVRPYICSLLILLYRINPNLIENFTDEFYFFSINKNFYYRYLRIDQLFPDLKKIKIFEIEVQWMKEYPSDVDESSVAVRDWYIENENNNTTYLNLDNVNIFAKNNSNLEVTYHVCENNLENLNQHYINSLKYKLESFNFFLLTQVVEYSEYIKNSSYPTEFLNGKANDYYTFVQNNTLNSRQKILNLNRRPDFHRHVIAQSILSYYENKTNRIRLTWLDETVKSYKQHKMNNGKGELVNFSEVFLTELNNNERMHFERGETILKSTNFKFDLDIRNEEFLMRYYDIIENYKDVGLEIVSESIFFGPLGDVSEKSLRPMVLGIPCIIVAGYNSFKILEKLGFKSYDFVTGYKDDEKNHLIRIRSALEFVNNLSLLSDEEYQDQMNNFYERSKPIIEHNLENFRSGNAVEKFISWVKQIHQ